MNMEEAISGVLRTIPLMRDGCSTGREGSPGWLNIPWQIPKAIKRKRDQKPYRRVRAGLFLPRIW